MTRNDRKELVEDICDAISQSYGSLKTVNKFDTKNARSVLDVAESAITLIEAYSDDVETLSGSIKKKLVVEILNRVINIKIKYVPKVIREKIEGYIIEMVVEFIITMFNKYVGKRWLKTGENNERR